MASGSDQVPPDALRAKLLRSSIPLAAEANSLRSRKRLLPEDYLQRAMRAKSAQARANFALRGLAAPADLDETTHAMLLRQLYMARFEQGDFAEAYTLGTQAVKLGVLPDVIHQDMARAKQALGDTDAAVGHLRLAARLGPASRKAFHWWTAGSLLFVAGRHEEAISALQRAARWGTTDKPLYQGHLALAKSRAGKRVRGLNSVIERLSACPAGQGYGRFVLGHLAFETERFDDARRHLTAFVKRTKAGRTPMRIALSAELDMAAATLVELNVS